MHPIVKELIREEIDETDWIGKEVDWKKM